jgi:hypothetical protein
MVMGGGVVHDFLDVAVVELPQAGKSKTIAAIKSKENDILVNRELNFMRKLLKSVVLIQLVNYYCSEMVTV